MGEAILEPWSTTLLDRALFVCPGENDYAIPVQFSLCGIPRARPIQKSERGAF